MKIGILFDLDGTLLDTIEDLADSVNYALAQYGCPARTVEEVTSFVGNGAKKLIQLSLPGKEDDPDVDIVLKTYQEYYALHSQVKTKPYEGIPEQLKAIGEKFPVAIVSNKPDKAVKLLCEDLFPGVYALGERADCPRKPAPDMLYKAMEHLGVEKCIYVGDSEVDVTTSKNAGAPCLSVTWGFREEEVLASAGGKYFCRKPEQLQEKIEQIYKEVFDKA